MEALKALQEKVKTDGKLQPWLAKHGLESLQGLWSQIHVEAGWENALEAALRERLGALEVSRLDMVRGFLGAGGRMPRLRGWRFTPTPTPASVLTGHGPCRCWRICCACSDAGLQAPC